MDDIYWKNFAYRATAEKGLYDELSFNDLLVHESLTDLTRT